MMLARRRTAVLGLAALAGGASLAPLSGCASLNSLSVEVSTYGDWPDQSRRGTYALERLPSQAAEAVRHEPVEVAAKAALEKAGFVAAAPGSTPDVLVQVGARLTRSDRSPWDDPFWWRGGWGVGSWYRGVWVGPRFAYGHPAWDTRRYEHEVALLLRDRTSGQPMYEARASVESLSRGSNETLKAMFEAALTGFPASGQKNPRRVTVALG